MCLSRPVPTFILQQTEVLKFNFSFVSESPGDNGKFQEQFPNNNNNNEGMRWGSNTIWSQQTNLMGWEGLTNLKWFNECSTVKVTETQKNMNRSSILSLHSLIFQIKDSVFQSRQDLLLLCENLVKWNRRSLGRSSGWEIVQDRKACGDLRMDADRAHLAPFVPDGGTNGGGGAPHVRRLRTLKRKKEEKVNTRNQVKLERVLGLTVASNASLATAPATGEKKRTVLGSVTPWWWWWWWW